MTQKEIVMSRLQQLVVAYLPHVDAFNRGRAEKELNDLLQFVDQNLREPEPKEDVPPKE